MMIGGSSRGKREREREKEKEPRAMLSSVIAILDHENERPLLSRGENESPEGIVRTTSIMSLRVCTYVSL